MTNNKDSQVELKGALEGEQYPDGAEAKLEIGSIEPAQITKQDLSEHDWSVESETSLIAALEILLSLSGLAYSEGAIRDLPDLRSEIFDLKSAVSALDNAGYDTSFGEMPTDTLREALLPAIGFLKDNKSAVVISEVNDEGEVTLRGRANGAMTEIKLHRAELSEVVEPYLILARKRDSNARVKRKNDWFWTSISQNRLLYSQVILAAALTNFLGLSSSLFIMIVYDRVVPNQAIESLIALTIGVLIALVFEFVIKTLRGQFVDTAGRKADGRMARLIFEKILSMRPDKKRQNAGSMASIVREFDTIREFFASATIVAIVDLPFVLLFIWVISLIAGPLAIVPMIAVPLVIISGLAIQPFLSRISDGTMKSGMSKQGVLIETLNGLETVQATGSGFLMRKRFEEASETQSALNFRTRMLSQFAVNSTLSIQQLAQIGTIVYGVFLIQDNTITSGALIAAVILGGRALAPLSLLASAMSRANSAQSAFKSLSKIMEDTDDTTADVIARPRLSRPHLRGDIEFKNVTYGFPGANAPIINNLSFKIAAGQRVAVLGRMGSGKSTLIRLVAGLLEPTSGSVLIDGVDIRQIDKSDLRRNVGVMLQETWLFSGTVKENLQMGFYEYSDAHLLDIAKVSGVDDFVGGHPEGYDMELRERGEGLSGGQRQSINLARSLIHNPNTLVFDEPTSSMDTATEKAVITRLQEWCAGKTMVMVTHRNTLLDLADRVFVMDKGTIIADTTPAQIRKSA